MPAGGGETRTALILHESVCSGGTQQSVSVGEDFEIYARLRLGHGLRERVEHETAVGRVGHHVVQTLLAILTDHAEETLKVGLGAAQFLLRKELGFERSQAQRLQVRPGLRGFADQHEASLDLLRRPCPPAERSPLLTHPNEMYDMLEAVERVRQCRRRNRIRLKGSAGETKPKVIRSRAHGPVLPL